jgi:PKHD-type hydroxylase
MNGLWCYHFKKWSSQYCSDLLKKAEKYEWSTGVVGDSIVDTSLRRSKVKFINADDYEFKYMFDELWLMMIEANQKFFNFHISKLDFFQIGEYDESNRGEYGKHHDVFWITKDPIYHRKLSCSIQLSDPNSYEGGDLIFEDLDGHDHPKPYDIRQQGSVVFFPSFLNHKVTPVTKGKRHSLVAWFEGPKWR